MKHPNITRGNSCYLAMYLYRETPQGREPVAVEDIADMLIKMIRGNTVIATTYTAENNVVIIYVPDTLAVGSYSIELTGTIGIGRVRIARKYAFEVSEWTDQSAMDGVVADMTIRLEDGLFVLSADTSGIQAIEEQLQEALAAAIAVKEEWEAKVQEISDVAKETTATANKNTILTAVNSAATLQAKETTATANKQEILHAIENIDIDTTTLAKEATAQGIVSKIGTPASGESVVGMISDVKTLIGYTISEIDNV